MIVPMIGITTSIQIVTDGLFSGNDRCYLNSDYVRGVIQSGGTPLMLPAVDALSAVRRYVEKMDGIILSGGYDVDPQRYGEEPRPKLGPIMAEQDEYELAVATIAKEMNKPILGICRGAQIINVANGGTLYQDLTDIGRPVSKHYQESLKYVPGHTVAITAGTKLKTILGEELVRTNSFHHQAVKDLAPGFVVNARSLDGVVEGLESRYEPIIGVQWHPEMMLAKYSIMLGLFQWLVDASRGVASKDSKQKGSAR